jgi:hypothetical protein
MQLDDFDIVNVASGITGTAHADGDYFLGLIHGVVSYL